MSLEKIRLDYENESGFTSAKILRPYLTLTNKDWAIIAERYAQQRVNEVLDKAAEEVRLKHEGRKGSYIRYFIPFKEEPIIVDKESILKLKKDVRL